MKYILDFDRTLFDTPSCYSKIYEIQGDEYVLIPELWAEINACEYLYDDVLGWLSEKSKDDLFILTAISPKYGESAADYQKEKLSCSKVEDLVSDVIFVEGLKGKHVVEIAKQFPPNENLVFVDDTIDQCLSVKSALPNAICCLMVRDKSVIGEVKSGKDIKVVSSLSEVDDIIEHDFA